MSRGTGKRILLRELSERNRNRESMPLRSFGLWNRAPSITASCAWTCLEGPYHCMAIGMHSQSGQAGCHDRSLMECKPIQHDVIVIGVPWEVSAIFRGCMPSKTILRSAEVAALMRRSKESGLSPVDIKAISDELLDAYNQPNSLLILGR